MKKNLVLLSGLLSFTLVGCDQFTDMTHKHTFSETYSSNETMHWQEATCEHSSITQNLGVHAYNDQGVCDICGAVKPADPEPAHEHTFSTEWSKNETGHWHVATCDHAELIKDYAVHEYNDQGVCSTCGFVKPADPEPAHEHTFSENWKYTETMHWQEANCGHNGLTQNLGEHTFDADGRCTACGALVINNHVVPQSVGEGNYPYILKAYDQNGEVVYNNTYGDGGKIMTAISWDALEKHNEYYVTIYNDDGREIRSYNHLEGSEPTHDTSYEYNDKGLLLRQYNSLDLTKTQIIYTYDAQGRVIRKSWQEGNPLAEYRYEKTTYYDDYKIIEYSKDQYDTRLITDKVVYSTEGSLKVESRFRSYIPDEGDPVDWYPIGVLKYDENNNVVYADDINRDTTHELEEATYTVNGEVESITCSNQSGYEYKTIYNYDSNDFLESSCTYYYDGSDFTIKGVEYKYWCDSKGSVIAMEYKHYDGEVVDQEIFQYYQLIYTNFKSECMYVNYSTPYFGSYTTTEKSFLAIIG